MSRHGVKFIRGSVPHVIEGRTDGKKRVVWKQQQQSPVSAEDSKEGVESHKVEVNVEDVFDTVMLAIGRVSDTKKIGLEAIGINVKSNGKILCNDDDTTSVEGIFAIGDCVDKRPELTPTAIKAGRLLARRLFNHEKKLMDYQSIATTVFTPLEYGTIG